MFTALMPCKSWLSTLSTVPSVMSLMPWKTILILVTALYVSNQSKNVCVSRMQLFVMWTESVQLIELFWNEHDSLTFMIGDFSVPMQVIFDRMQCEVTNEPAPHHAFHFLQKK